MSSVPEMAIELADHPAAREAAEAMRSLARGVRPQWEAQRPVPTRPVQVPIHNRRVAAVLTARQQLAAREGRRLTVAEPHRLVFRSLLGARRVRFGYALNMEFVYHSPSGADYVLTGIATGYADGPLTGQGWARECSCPDFQKRRGAARDQIHGEARCCKHMRLLLVVIATWQGQWPQMAAVPRRELPDGAGFQLREF